MAVLQYPIEPHAYWTFDRHETLFEDRNESRYQPSPAWNREIKNPDLKYYWTFDDNDSGILDQIEDVVDNKLQLVSDKTLAEVEFQSWGLLGKSLTLEDAEINASKFLESTDQNFTLSFWVKPQGDFNISISEASPELDISYDLNSNEFFHWTRLCTRPYLLTKLTIGCTSLWFVILERLSFL